MRVREHRDTWRTSDIRLQGRFSHLTPAALDARSHLPERQEEKKDF